MDKNQGSANKVWRGKLHEIIFEADTTAGKYFDIFLIVSILLSVGVIMLDSVEPIHIQHGEMFEWLEWFFTILFTIEYCLRLISVCKPLKYAASFLGIVDFTAILPTYLSLILPGVQYLLIIRMLRVLRIFRVLKLAQYLSEAKTLTSALRASRRKITIFLFVVITLATIFGSFMYLVEGAENGFSSIPRSIYWAIVTLTTVGYGDIAPQTNFGQIIASIIMVLGYGIIAVPTGIVTVELGRVQAKAVTTQACPACGSEGHDADALYCKRCGQKL